MTASLYQKIDDKAQKLLEKADALTYPVDIIRQVAGHLKLVVDETVLEDEYSGFLAVQEKTIVVNARHAPVRRRFTVAHEIGHYQLHRRQNKDKNVFIDRTVYYRKEEAEDMDYQMEMQANAYAAGLLMPEVLLDEYLEKHPRLDLSRRDDIKTLADEFDVSRPAMEWRLRNLGFLLPTSF